jgi:hypothetical protein
MATDDMPWTLAPASVPRDTEFDPCDVWPAHDPSATELIPCTFPENTPMAIDADP